MLLPIISLVFCFCFRIETVAPSPVRNLLSIGSMKRESDVDDYCFEHVTTESTSSYQIGDILQVCLKATVPDDRDSGIDTATVRVAESHINHRSSHKRLSEQTRLFLTDTSASIVIYVDDTTDSAGNISSCQVSSPSVGCNLRSALLLCSESLTLMDHNCTVILPAQKTIVLDTSLGELSMIDALGTLRIEGTGCSIISSDSADIGNYIRFLNISFGSASTETSPSDSPREFIFHLSNLTLDGFGDPTLKGGTIYLNSLTGGSIQDVTCSHSRGSYGAAVFLDQSRQFLISRSRFENNTATGDGGALYLESNNKYITVVDCDISHNTAQGLLGERLALGGGVALHSHNSYVSFRSTLFLNNSGARGGGLGFYDTNTFAVLYKCVVEGNEATINGGGVYMVFDNSDMRIEECDFLDNSAEYGGAIRLWTGAYDVYLLRSNFMGNSAVVAGGAVHVYGNNFNMRIEDCTFRANTCLDYGGAMAINSGNYYMNFTKCIFDSNEASSYGGALALLSDNRYVVVSECSFDNNIAGLAGGAYYSLVLNTFTTIEQSSFVSNVATLYGGALYFGNNHQQMSFLLCEMNDNGAESGAGVYIAGFNNGFTFDSCNVEHNQAVNVGGGVYCLGEDVTFANCFIHNNTAKTGGGLYFQSGSERQSQKCSVLNSSFISNVGYTTSGAMAIDLVADVEVRDCIFEANTAYHGSGALGISRSDMVNISNSRFLGNKCPSNGGGLYLTRSSHVALHNTSFEENVAIVGGAMWIHSCSDVEVSHCILYHNVASLKGGGMFLNSSQQVLITSSSFESNVARTSSGSVIWADQTEPLELDMNYFANNTAFGGGTVFFVQSSSMAEPIGLRSDRNYFDVSNTAMYGDYWATQGTTLKTASPEINVTVYDQNLAPLVIHLHDYFGQLVLMESNSETILVFLRVLIGADCDGLEGYFTGDVFQSFVNGEVVFDQMQALCAPGHNMDIAVISGNRDISPLVINMEFRHCETGEFYADRMCSPCRNGTFSITDPTGLMLSEIREVNVCRDCPSGVSSCFADTLVLDKGYWRVGTEAVDVLSCPMEGNSCVGGAGTGEDLCAQGYEGPLCAVCDSGYHRSASGTSCDQCSRTSSWIDAFTITVLVIFLLFVGIAIIFIRKVVIRKEKIEELDDILGLLLVRIGVLKMKNFTAKRMKVRRKVQKIRRQLMARLKIYISFFQILSVLSYVLDFRFPDIFNHIVNVFRAFVNLSISGSTVVNCSMGNNFDYIDKLLFDTIYPLVVVVIIFAVCCIHLSRIPTSKTERLESVRAIYTFAFLLFLYMILPFTSSTIFQTFSCTNIDPNDVDSASDDQYMTADFSISCESDRYHFGILYAICAIVVYPIGVPALYFRLLYHHKDDISSRFMPTENETAHVERLVRLRPFIFLYDNYKCDFWYWEVVETLYRLALTGLLVLVAQGSSLQIVVGFCFAIFFFLVYQHFTPFHDPTLQQLQHTSLFQVASIFFIALTIKADFVDENNVMINILLVVAIFLNFILDLLSFIGNNYVYPLFFTPLELRDTSLGGSSASFSESESTAGVMKLKGDSFSEERSLEQGGAGVVMSALHVHGSNNYLAGEKEKKKEKFNDDNDDGCIPGRRSERGSSFIEMSPRVLSVLR